MTTCGACQFYERLPAEEKVRLELQGYRVPEKMGHCGWTPPEVLILPKAYTIQIRPMHEDDAEECEKFLELEDAPPGEPEKGPPRVLKLKPKSDVDDLIS